MLAFLLPVLVATSTGAAAPAAPPGTVTGGIGFEYRDVDGPGDSYANPFVYPNTGITVDTKHLFLDVNTPLPVLLPDLIATLVIWLANGNDDVPLWHALNGEKEPGAVRFGDATARYPIAFEGMTALELGATTSFTIVSIFVPHPEGEADIRIPAQPRVFAPSMGFRAGLPDGPVLRGTAYAGNAWTHHATWNPIVGIGARSAMPFGRRVVFELRGDIAWNRLDFTSYREPFSDVPVAGTQWYRVWSAEARLALRWPLR